MCILDLDLIRRMLWEWTWQLLRFQIAYHSDAIGKDSAESYVDELIEYHELADDIALDKKEELLKLT